MIKLSLVLFILGLSALLISNIILIYHSRDYYYLAMFLFATILLLLGWVLRDKEEKYRNCFGWPNAYDRSIQSGKIVAGTVYADYPENTPGLGWLP
jgi:hypothetical protein